MKKLSIAAGLLLAALILSACGAPAPATQPDEPKAPEIIQPDAGASVTEEVVPAPVPAPSVSAPAGQEPIPPVSAEPAPAASQPAEVVAPNPVRPDEPPAATRLTKAQAEAIALQHAGVSAGQVKGLKSELDVDKGVAHYEVEFRVGQWEYEYDIHADTGAVLSFEKDD